MPEANFVELHNSQIDAEPIIVTASDIIIEQQPEYDYYMWG